MSTNKVEKNQFESVVQRLMEALSLKNEYNIAELLGFKKDTFSARKKRGAIPIDKIRLLCTEKGINFNWVMTGTGHRSETVKEPETEYHGYIRAVADMMAAMDEDTQKDIFLSVQKEKLLRELLKERIEKRVNEK